MTKRMYGVKRTRRMRGGRKTRRTSRKMYGGRRTRRPRTRRPRTRRSFMMYGGERPPSSIGGSTFIRHNNLGNAEVKVTLLPKDGNTPVVSNTISSDSINNIAPFLKGNEIHYENMKWEVSSGELPTLTIPGDKFNEQPEKKSKIILIYKESTDDKLNYKLMHDEKTMNPKNPEVLDYVKTLVEGSVPSV